MAKIKGRAVKNINELSKSEDVNAALKNVYPLDKPKINITKYLNNMQNIGDLSDKTLEAYLGVFIAWQNYVGTQLVISEVIKAVAENQKNYFFNLALNAITEKMSITEKKNKAAVDITYLNAVKVYNKAKAGYKGLQTLFNSCDQAFKAVSRVITIREKLIIG